ncbi:MAG: serpin family protein [Candidatus Borkfalkiaceae bacterium]|nr:serpin family protein [Christensenellaceae bacterium]
MKKFVSGCLALLCTVSFMGCGGFTERTVKTKNLAETVAAREVNTLNPADYRTAYNDFSVKLLGELYKLEENKNTFCISPLSVAAAFGMITNGAKGETKTQLEATLGSDSQALNEYFAEFIKETKKSETVHIANSVWGRKNAVNVKNSFLDVVKNYYQADYYAADFKSDTLNDINNWIYNNTRGGIDKALDQIDDETLLYLINALDFEAEWSKRFSKNATADQIFHGSKEDKTVKMMKSTEYLYIGTDKASGFIKDYKKGGYYFAGLLPDGDYSVTDVLAELVDGGLNSALANPQYPKINLTLPKFDFACDYHLIPALNNLGIKAAFSPNYADFSDLGNSVGGNPIFVKDVIHKTHIALNEEGTKASAVTIIAGAGSAAPPEDEIDLVFDHPFIFMICDKNNMPLFIGIIENL